MNSKCDRRLILRFIGSLFPSLNYTATFRKGLNNPTSDEVHGFLDEITGLKTPLDEPNSSAFDKWRQALAAQGYPVWGITQERADTIKAGAEKLKTEEAKRLKELPDLLAKLRQDAPLVTAAQLMKQAEKQAGPKP